MPAGKISLHFSLLLVLSLMLGACGRDSEEELRGKEQKKLDEYLNKSSLTFYKALKVGMRCSADPSADPEMRAAAGTIMKLGLRGASLAFDSTQSISVGELLVMGHDFYKARDVLIRKDEDDLPTVYENIGFLLGGNSRISPPVFGNFTYDKNFEHVLFGLLWTATLKAPPSFPLYELHKVDDAKVPFEPVRLLAELSKALSYSMTDFHWHCLDESALYIKDLEKKKAEYLKTPFLAMPGAVKVEQSYYQFHLMGMALHGISHLELEHEDDAMKDFEVVLEDAEKGGIDNEITWLVGAYVHIKKEEKEKAIADLKKLQGSEMMDEAEKAAIAEGIAYLEARENDKAFLKIRDKLALSRIGFHLFRNRVKELDEIKKVQASSEGKRLFSVQEKLGENSSTIEKISGGMSVDSLASSAKGLVKDLFGK